MLLDSLRIAYINNVYIMYVYYNDFHIFNPITTIVASSHDDCSRCFAFLDFGFLVRCDGYRDSLAKLHRIYDGSLGVVVSWIFNKVSFINFNISLFTTFALRSVGNSS